MRNCGSIRRKYILDVIPSLQIHKLRNIFSQTGIPCSRENPKILWVNDAEVVGY